MTDCVFHVAKKRELGLDVVAQGHLGAADQRVRLDADLAQFLDGVLRRLGLEFPAGAQIGNVGEVRHHGVATADIEQKLANGLEEGQALDVTHGATELTDEHVGVPGAAADRCP